MAYTNRTKEFLDLVHSKSSSQPSRKHQGFKQIRQDRERDEQVQFGKQFVIDAYTIVSRT